jgi:hypothetical protein
MAAGPPTPPIPSSAAPAPGTDYPLRLGDSFEPGRQQQGAGAVELYSFSYNFQPESVLNATAGLLITIKADQSADSRVNGVHGELQPLPSPLLGEEVACMGGRLQALDGMELGVASTLSSQRGVELPCLAHLNT